MGNAESFTYDPIGNVTAHTDFNGQTTRFTYDASNRLLSRAFPDGTSVTFTYSPRGERLTATDGRGVTRYEYDGIGQLTRAHRTRRDSDFLYLQCRAQPGVGHGSFGNDHVRVRRGESFARAHRAGRRRDDLYLRRRRQSPSHDISEPHTNRSQLRQPGSGDTSRESSARQQHHVRRSAIHWDRSAIVCL